jgi:hypothetical protein
MAEARKNVKGSQEAHSRQLSPALDAQQTLPGKAQQRWASSCNQIHDWQASPDASEEGL